MLKQKSAAPGYGSLSAAVAAKRAWRAKLSTWRFFLGKSIAAASSDYEEEKKVEELSAACVKGAAQNCGRMCSWFGFGKRGKCEGVCGRILFLLVITIIAIIGWLALISRGSSNICWELLTGLLITMLFWVCFMCMCGKTFASPLFCMFSAVVILALLGIAFLPGPSTDPLFPSIAREVPEVKGTLTNETWVHSNQDATQPYPVCLMSWGAYKEIDVIDLAVLSSYSYAHYGEDQPVYNYTRGLFSNDQTIAEVIHHDTMTTVGRTIATRFRRKNSSKGTIVLTVKGSSELFDFYADAQLWGMVAAFQVLVPFLNLLDLLPNGIFADLFLKLKQWVDEGDSPFEPVKHMYENLSNTPMYANDTFIVTGHSLGGGIATAAGGHFSENSSHPVYAVAFSGPGSHFSRWRFGTSKERAWRSAVDIKPALDVIHTFDRHDEMGQYIECQTANPKECHSILSTICELWRVCGYHRPQRNFKHMCKDVFNNILPTPIDKYLTQPGHFGDL